MNKTPEIRFKGFSGDWEEKKLGDIVKINSGRDYKHLGNGNIPVYGTGGYMLSVNEALSLENAIGIGRKGTINKPQFLEAPFWTVDTLFFMTIKNNNKLKFVYSLSENINWKKFDESTGVPSLSKSTIEKIKINIPIDFQEQEKIGDFFKQLDDHIAFCEEELENLKLSKKGFLQKMFPKKGERVPEIRFPEFIGDWEEKKVNEVINIFDNLRVPIKKSDRYRGDTPYYGANGVQDYVEGYTHSGEYVLIAEDGANDVYDYPVNYVIGEIWVNNHAHVLSGKDGILNNLFLSSRIQSMNISKYLVGGGRAKLNVETLKKIILIIPTLPEQEKIGAFFKQLDGNIKIYEEKLEALKKSKKAFLQKLFV